MKIYLICPVRNATQEQREMEENYTKMLEAVGHTVYLPHRDAPQDDPTGEAICQKHRQAMEDSDVVYVIWDKNSFGSHWDMGMAYAMRKPVQLLHTIHKDTPGKSYYKVLCSLSEECYLSNVENFVRTLKKMRGEK